MGHVAPLCFVSTLVPVAIVAMGSVTGAQIPPPAPIVRTTAPQLSAGVFTPEQATRGSQLYESSCAQCHLSNLKGSEMAPPLTGEAFLSAWAGKPLRALFSVIVSTMPQSEPGSMSGTDVLDVVAYILEVNGFPSGPTRLASPEDAEAITITRPE
jgi:mono/diheme cytochrome c family protein